MELVVSLAVGVMAAAGVWLLLRPRTFQVLIGLALLSYAVNLFIFSVGSLSVGREPIVRAGSPADLAHYTDPLPQSLVLTAIVIGFGLQAFALVLLKRAHQAVGTDDLDAHRLERDDLLFPRDHGRDFHAALAVLHPLRREVERHRALLRAVELSQIERPRGGALHQLDDRARPRRVPDGLDAQERPGPRRK